jgi:hypothetical protein
MQEPRTKTIMEVLFEHKLDLVSVVFRDGEKKLRTETQKHYGRSKDCAKCAREVHRAQAHVLWESYGTRLTPNGVRLVIGASCGVFVVAALLCWL